MRYLTDEESSALKDPATFSRDHESTGWQLASVHLRQEEIGALVLARSQLSDLLIELGALTGWQLTESRLDSVRVEGTLLKQWQCKNVQFANCVFTAANFAGSHFDACHFLNCTFDEARFEKTRFSHCAFEDVTDTAGNFREATFDGTRFEKGKLTETGFARSQGELAFLGTELVDTDFSYAGLNTLSLEKANVSSAAFDSATLTSLALNGCAVDNASMVALQANRVALNGCPTVQGLLLAQAKLGTLELTDCNDCVDIVLEEAEIDAFSASGSKLAFVDCARSRVGQLRLQRTLTQGLSLAGAHIPSLSFETVQLAGYVDAHDAQLERIAATGAQLAADLEVNEAGTRYAAGSTPLSRVLRP